MNQNLILIANEKCWIEQTAKDQLVKVADLPGVIRAVGLPDLHAGKSPIGIAVLTEGVLYPHLIGNDIGCGMGLFETPIALRKYRQDKLVTRLNHIRELSDIPAAHPYGEESPIYDLGTIGGGNHFAEFQRVAKVFDPEGFDKLQMDKDRVHLLVHSGSRGYGQRILEEFDAAEGLPEGSAQAEGYLKAHDDALLWAGRNRAVVAQKLIDWLGYGAEVKPILDCCHNFLEKTGGGFLHRKGAVSALSGPVVIPGSRGSLTYIVKPLGDTDISLASLSHGAGRKWARSLCKSRIKNKYDRDSIRENPFGGRVVCHDTDLLFQEAPEAYKNIEQVINSLVDSGLCRVIATLAPLITYKG